MSSIWRAITPRAPGRLLAISGVMSATLYAMQVSPAAAQNTVYVGGSGQPNVEVNLDVLNDLYGAGDGRELLHPGEKPLYLRRSMPPKIIGQNIIRVPAPPTGTPKTAVTPLIRPGAQTVSRPPAQPVLRAPAQKAVPKVATKPLIPASPPVQAPAQAQVQAPALAQLPETTKKPVRRAPPAPLQPMPSTTQPLPSKKDQERLTELATLRSEDLISDSDYAAKRAEILGGPKKAAPPPVPTLAAPPVPAATPAPAPKKITKPRVTTPALAPPAPPQVVTEAAPPAPKATPPAAKETKVASIPKQPVPIDGIRQLRLEFESSASGLTPSQTDQLKDLAGRLQSGDVRLQVRAYAGATGEDTGSARRSSLKRALAVRSRLIEGGIRSTRIDVRALGAAGDDGPADRVDIYSVVR